MDISTKRKTILIIGAGPSGLVSAKEALDNGLEPLILEKTSNIGGVWHPETGSVWSTMHTNLSKYSCSFTEFPWNEKVDMFPSSLEMFNYLEAYAKNFNLFPRIRFNHIVRNIYKSESGMGWLVDWLDDRGQKCSAILDGVIVCSGIFSGSYTPPIPGLQNFTGKQDHSKNYKDGSVFEGQTVLVVGGGISGEQIASDLSNHAKKVIHSFRKPFWLVNPYLHENPSDPDSSILPLDFVFYNRNFYSKPSISDPVESSLKKNFYMSSLCQAQQLISELHISERIFSEPINATVSSQYLDSVKKDIVVPKRGNIQKFDASKVILEGGEEIEINSIVFSTGFKVNVPFLSEEILDIVRFNQEDQLQPLILYKTTLHPDLPNLYFVGMYKGPYFAVMELQARWSCRLLSGKVALPAQGRIDKGLEAEFEIREQMPRGQFPHPEYVQFADEIAELAGSYPSFVKLKELHFSNSLSSDAAISDLCDLQRKIYNKMMTSAVIPEHYNLFENASSALERINKVMAEINKFSSTKKKVK